MKKATLLLALFGLSLTAATAQTTPKTDVNVRDNGTVKTTTKNADGSEVTVKSGRTNTGEVLHAGKVKTEHGAKKAGAAVKHGAKKTKAAVTKGSNKVADKAKDVAN